MPRGICGWVHQILESPARRVVGTFEQFPITMNALVGGGVFFAGELIAQSMAPVNTGVDFSRCGTIALLGEGFLFVGVASVLISFIFLSKVALRMARAFSCGTDFFFGSLVHQAPLL
jgi:hypothetical protein